MITVNGKYTSAMVTVDELDENALAQIKSMCDHPSCTNPIAIMPDTHLGKGCVIGFTMELGDKVVPNYVGVDVGCGMLTTYLNKPMDHLFFKKQKEDFDADVRKVVPMGFNIGTDLPRCFKDGTFLADLNWRLRVFHAGFVNKYGTVNALPCPLDTFLDISEFEAYADRFDGNVDRIMNSLGSLGGGNHFIEVGQSEKTGKMAITVHTGSRNFGKQVCDYHQNKAWAIIEDTKKNKKKEYVDGLVADMEDGELSPADMPMAIREFDRVHQVSGITKVDAFLEGADMYEYLFDMVIAQTYASWNRKVIMEKIIALFEQPDIVVDKIESIHNFIDFNDFVVRKGAIRSYKGEDMIIPFNSRDGILICRGKSNADWNCSAPHGAGRVKARGVASREISKELAAEVMSGVFATETPADESPLCYKKAEFIEGAIAPTADIIDRIKPIINFKA
jgi:RNA-splicing ligase RtcB